MKHLFSLLFLAALFAGCNSTDSTQLQQQIGSLEAQLDSMKNLAATETKPGLIHNVYFWLRDDITEEEKAKFMEGARSLATVPSVQAFYMGPHATTEARDVVDHSYDLSLVIFFADQAAEAAYQVDPIHTAFVEGSSGAWTTVKVYDVAVE